MDTTELVEYESGDPEQLTPGQQNFLAALLVHGSIKSACASVGVPYTTARRWLKSEPFATVYREARRDQLRSAWAILQAGASQAAMTLVAQLTADEADPARTAAARLVLDYATQIVHREQADEEMGELRRMLQELLANQAGAIQGGQATWSQSAAMADQPLLPGPRQQHLPRQWRAVVGKSDITIVQGEVMTNDNG